MKKILVIEDEALIRSNILDLLESENFQTIGAENGGIGIRLAQEQIPDLIICDIMMPDMDGYSVLTELRQNPVTEMIPFIFLTAKADRDDLRLGMELGADDYITKPCTLTELVSAIAARFTKHNAFIQQYKKEREKSQELQQKVLQLQEINETREDLLQRLSQELRDPVSTINLAIQMLKNSPSQQGQERYLKILQEECAREIAILNQFSNLQNFLTPENAKLLRRFNLLREQNHEKNSSH
ncbi:response regulator [Argonema antarcticum A004/B2]|nr:response regulator [Argonema antarcticum A004/B2]